jgi:hypothetical protein
MGHVFEGTAASFEIARAEFEAAWEEYLPQCTEGDFEAYRRQEAWTAWKYAMQEAHLPLPTQTSNGKARCFAVPQSTSTVPTGTFTRRIC